MDSLKENAIRYMDSENEYGEEKNQYHYNCAEVLLNASNDYYKLGADSKLLRSVIPFGGGISCESTCGALTGGVVALGLMFAEEKPSTNDRVKDITKEWVETFKERFGDIDCKKLKKIHRDPENGCRTLILESTEILESIIEQYK